jgi:hypothetical protein
MVPAALTRTARRIGFLNFGLFRPPVPETTRPTMRFRRPARKLAAPPVIADYP